MHQGLGGKSQGCRRVYGGSQGCTRAWEVSQGFTRVLGVESGVHQAVRGRVRGTGGYSGG